MLRQSGRSRSEHGPRIASRIFTSAGVIGIAEIAPLFVGEGLVGRAVPPPVTHPEFYYGFAGAVLAWHVAFLVIARDPSRYRAFVAVAILEKFLFAAAVLGLVVMHRIQSVAVIGAAGLDGVWFALFLASWRATDSERSVFPVSKEPHHAS